MIRWVITIVISFLLCGLLTNDIPKMIGMTMAMSFFVGIIWELIQYWIRGKNSK
jgi:lipopolysaccharide export LptBFGC system permease protein LptF